MLDGKRCPGIYVPPRFSDEWGIADAVDDDGDPPIHGQVPSTANITYIWYGINFTDKNLYLAIAREGNETSPGSGTSTFLFYLGTDCSLSMGDPDHDGADWAISFILNPSDPPLDDLTLWNWTGSGPTGYTDVTSGTNLEGYGRSFYCDPVNGTESNDKKFAELRIGIEHLIDPCSQSGCNNITILSGAVQAGGGQSAEKDRCAINGSLHVNAPPTADAGPDQIICIGETAYFNGSNSLGGDEAYGYNDIVLYQWDFDFDGNPDHFITDATGVTANHTYTAAGTYWVALNVTDAWGCCHADIDGLNVTVLDLHPAMTATKAADKSGPVELGETVNYTITLTNTGDANFTDVAVVDEMLDSLDLVSAANNSDGAFNISEIWRYEGTYIITAEDACQGWANNSASVYARTLCGNGTWQSNEVRIPVNYSGVCSNFSITKMAMEDVVEPDENVTYIINVTNTGIATLSTLKIVDVLPLGLVYVSDNSTPPGVATGNLVTWNNVGPLAAGASKFIQLVAKVQL